MSDENFQKVEEDKFYKTKNYETIKKWRVKNQEKYRTYVREYNKDYKQENRDKILDYAKEYYQKNKEKMKEQIKKSHYGYCAICDKECNYYKRHIKSKKHLKNCGG